MNNDQGSGLEMNLIRQTRRAAAVSVWSALRGFWAVRYFAGDSPGKRGTGQYAFLVSVTLRRCVQQRGIRTDFRRDLRRKTCSAPGEAAGRASHGAMALA